MERFLFLEMGQSVVNRRSCATEQFRFKCYKENRRSETGMNVAIGRAVFVAAGGNLVAEAKASLATL
jgi:hypothetical protein